jgi:hypothetical protein
MKTFNRKPLFLALAGITALGAVGTAQAVGVSATGLGDALVAPYYTVKGTVGTDAYNTLISIVNTTASVKAVKIRFREGKGSAEVLDFNIFLSPYDMWTANLKQDVGGGVVLRTSDKSCTIPRVVDGATFRNTLYVGDKAADNSLARLREGYFEVIEMATFSDASITGHYATHVSGVPRDCTQVTNDQANSDAYDPQGGLSGTVSLVSPGTGLNAAVDPTALVNCNELLGYQFSNQDTPTLGDCEAWSNTPTADGNSVHATWGNGQDAVSASLMKNAIINEYVLDSATNSATDWVITFPTKHHYVPNKGGLIKLFQSALTPTGACDDIILSVWDREEQQPPKGGDDFSPSQTTPFPQLCWEANILTFNNVNLFHSTNTLGYASIFQNGWARVDFIPSNTNLLISKPGAVLVEQNSASLSTTSDTGTFHGLPVIGFAVETFRPVGTSSYAGTFAHRFVPGTDQETNLRPRVTAN